MQSAAAVLGIIRERGRKGLPLERLYRCWFNPGLYLLAYGRIYRNDGAMTPGTTTETVDGMRLAKISAIIDALRVNAIEVPNAARLHRQEGNEQTASVRAADLVGQAPASSDPPAA
jgi:hypothetical protein